MFPLVRKVMISTGGKKKALVVFQLAGRVLLWEAKRFVFPDQESLFLFFRKFDIRKSLNAI